MPIATQAYANHAPDQPLGPFQLERRDPNPNDVAIRILFCGVCHSDLHTARGEWGGTRYPCVPGHEIVGVVSAVGGGAIRDISVGKIPEIFGGGPLYATAALLTSVLTVGCILLPVPGETVFLAIAAGAATAILAKWLRWRLPQHDDWSVTLSATQLKSLVRRVRRTEQKRVEAELQEAIDEIS